MVRYTSALKFHSRRTQPGLKALLLTLMAFFFFGTSSLFAQDEENPGPDRGMTIYHQPMEAENLPPPGKTMEISVELLNTRDLDRMMRAIVVADGRSLDIPITNIHLNKFDNPQYNFKIHAPVGEMSYQFFLTDHDGSLISSERYSIRRDCLPQLSEVDELMHEPLQGDERLQVLVNSVQGLKRERDALVEAKALLLELKKFVK